MIIFVKAISLIFLVLCLQIRSEEVNQKTPHISQEAETCLRFYKRYVQILKGIYSEDLEKMNQVQCQIFLDRKVIEFVRKCYTFSPQQHENVNLQMISNQTKTSLQQFLAYSSEIQSSLREQNMILQAIKRKKAQIEDGIVLFGYNLKKLPKNLKYYYLVIYALIAVGALIYGLKEMQNKQELIKRD